MRENTNGRRNEWNLFDTEEQQLCTMNDFELLRFVEAVEKDALLHAPVHMKENILKESVSPAVQFSVTTKRVSKKVQLFWYGLRVSAAVAGALAILTVMSIPSDFITLPKLERTKMEWNITEKLYNGSNKVSNFLEEISNQIVMEKNVPEGR